MKHFFTICTLLCAFLLTACGGDSDKPLPIANAGTDTTVEIDTSVTLDGSASTSPRADATLTYSWTLLAKPDNSEAALTDADTATPTFIVDYPGTYEADLVVNDSTLDSEHDRVIITVTNPNPIAIIQTEFQELIGSTIVLDASASIPPTGIDASALVYTWTLELPEFIIPGPPSYWPAGVPFPGWPQDYLDGLIAAYNTNAAQLEGVNTDQASIYLDIEGVYQATLLIEYQDKSSELVTIMITSNLGNYNTKPVADAGTTYTVDKGQTITLDGSASSDADGDALSYRWSFLNVRGVVKIPAGSDLVLETAMQDYNTATPSFTPDVVGTWTAFLTVFDGTQISSIAQTEITVTKPNDEANIPPVAAFYGKQKLGFMTPIHSKEVELGANIWSSGNSWDIDNTTRVTRSYEWITTPDDYTQEDISDYTSFHFTPDVAGEYIVEMIVNDGEDYSTPAQKTFIARTGANTEPRAILTVDTGTVMVGDTAWFDARTSSDPENDQLSYQWLLFDKPDNSEATLAFENVTLADGTVLENARASIVTDQAGAYIVLLGVTDSHGVTSQATSAIFEQVLAKIENNAPSLDTPHAYIAKDPFSGFDQYRDGQRLEEYVNAPYLAHNTNPAYYYLGMDETQPAIVGAPVHIIIRATDPDQDDFQLLWTIEDQPEDSVLEDSVYTITADLADFLGSTRIYEFTPTVAGDYTFNMIASDGALKSEAQSITIHVAAQNDYPTLKLAYGRYIAGDGYPGYVPDDFATTEIRNSHRSETLPFRAITTLSDTTQQFNLTAFNGDYTITDLAVTSSYGGTQEASIFGLTEGQVIKEGESVNFALVMPTDIEHAENTEFSFYFKIKEREDWYFHLQNIDDTH